MLCSYDWFCHTRLLLPHGVYNCYNTLCMTEENNVVTANCTKSKNPFVNIEGSPALFMQYYLLNYINSSMK